ncbi:acetyltransferase [Psychroflexus sp. YR1-1]|uniref:Acetyltransferase n=1 Tax=Psychroflexus aurantiacus TaxID=2709310 RepID=A0A6B3QYH9_9FLAO|nr:acetyltransferase [Psychroflexus aurantiacus]NEV92738.1 acetyltransferase [Psychroflexus aurantiacus]
MLNKKAVLVGYSGHALVVGDTAILSGIDLSYYTDKRENTNNVFNLEYLGFEGDVYYRHWSKNYSYILGIGDNSIREKTAQILLKNQQEILNIHHKSASISKLAKLGKGCFVGSHVSLNALASIGDFCVLNTGCIIEHECNIQQSSHIAPGAVLAGNVSVGCRTFVGANSVIKQGVKIGDDVIIGAGSVVINDIPDHTTVVGNPTKEINK